MTSILSRIIPGQKTKTAARLEAARAELDRRKAELAKAERTKADALSAATNKIMAAQSAFDASGSADDAELLTGAETALAEISARHDRTIARLREAVATHAAAMQSLEIEAEAEALVSAFGARHASFVTFASKLAELLEKCPRPAELPEVSPEARILALTLLDALPAGAKRSAEITGFGGFGVLELAPRRQELLTIAERVSGLGRLLSAIAVASADLEMLRVQIDAPPSPLRITPAAE